MDILAQAERENLPFLHLFILLRSSMNWMMPTCMGGLLDFFSFFLTVQGLHCSAQASLVAGHGLYSMQAQ